MIARIIEADIPISKKMGPLPRLAVVGNPCVGTDFFEGVIQNGLAEIVAFADGRRRHSSILKAIAPQARIVTRMEDFGEMKLDGILVEDIQPATVKQTLAFLQKGVSVFCSQLPASSSLETRRLVRAARKGNRLFAADFFHHRLPGIESLRALLRGRELGNLFAAEFVFHMVKPAPVRAPKAGCLPSLGLPLLDLLLWCLDYPTVKEVTSRLCADGQALLLPSREREDFAAARLILESGMSVQIFCSWKLPAGCDPIITGAFYGTQGTAGFRNLNGSRDQFSITHCHGGRTVSLSSVATSESCALQWVRQLAEGPCYKPDIEQLIPLACTLERISGRV